MPRFLLLFLFLPLTLNAEEVLTPEQFESYSSGKTLYFAEAGQPYGAEQYLPNRQSIWQYADGSCAKGIWYAENDLICFVYDDDSGEHCWNFLKKPENRYAARAIGREPGADLEVIWKDQQPVICTGPEVGT
ncbi:MAG: hypothetical protein KDA67_14270 [Rhodobacteraceae bacterium]|nr:hypothetical protein [Paracoccaceae bacterium]